MNCFSVSDASTDILQMVTFFNITITTKALPRLVDVILYKKVGQVEKMTETIVDVETKQECPFTLALWKKALPRKVPMIYATLPEKCTSVVSQRVFLLTFYCCFRPYRSSLNKKSPEK